MAAMKLDFSNERVLAVVAHPDDAELLCAGTLARARGDGAAIGMAVLCRGDKGGADKTPANLGDVRRGEMKAAARLLGATLLLGEFPDGELQDTLPARRRTIELFRKFRPTLVLAHASPDYHPDHRAAGALAEAASWFCASKGHKTRSKPLASPPALWWMDTIGMHGFEPGFFVDVSEHLEMKEKMLLCHKSQLARGEDGDFSPLIEVLRRQSQARGLQSGAAAAEAFRIHPAFKRTRAW